MSSSLPSKEEGTTDLPMRESKQQPCPSAEWHKKWSGLHRTQNGEQGKTSFIEQSSQDLGFRSPLQEVGSPSLLPWVLGDPPVLPAVISSKEGTLIWQEMSM